MRLCGTNISDYDNFHQTPCYNQTRLFYNGNRKEFSSTFHFSFIV